jgi:hypothetical protein
MCPNETGGNLQDEEDFQEMKFVEIQSEEL